MIERPSDGQGLPYGPSGREVPLWANWQRMSEEGGDLIEGIFFGSNVGVNEPAFPIVTVHTIYKSGRRQPEVQSKATHGLLGVNCMVYVKCGQLGERKCIGIYVPAQSIKTCPLAAVNIEERASTHIGGLWMGHALAPSS